MRRSSLWMWDVELEGALDIWQPNLIQNGRASPSVQAQRSNSLASAQELANKNPNMASEASASHASTAESSENPHINPPTNVPRSTSAPPQKPPIAAPIAAPANNLPFNATLAPLNLRLDRTNYSY
ncbi:uncharacterized protein LOC133801352 [Humulus lupulus]|uniref:uncharacterized protein LOC133801352 n=1 Tax=Humulus lupulus TaxID=3486 RepID=UPI002B405381|nr:uncharacterized protein LOC133801352 [Humulus lupulus]